MTVTTSTIVGLQTSEFLNSKIVFQCIMDIPAFLDFSRICRCCLLQLDGPNKLKPLFSGAVDAMLREVCELKFPAVNFHVPTNNTNCDTFTGS